MKDNVEMSGKMTKIATNNDIQEKNGSSGMLLMRNLNCNATTTTVNLNLNANSSDSESERAHDGYWSVKLLPVRKFGSRSSSVQKLSSNNNNNNNNNNNFDTFDIINSNILNQGRRKKRLTKPRLEKLINITNTDESEKISDHLYFNVNESFRHHVDRYQNYYQNLYHISDDNCVTPRRLEKLSTANHSSIPMTDEEKVKNIIHRRSETPISVQIEMIEKLEKNNITEIKNELFVRKEKEEKQEDEQKQVEIESTSEFETDDPDKLLSIILNLTLKDINEIPAKHIMGMITPPEIATEREKSHHQLKNKIIRNMIAIGRRKFSIENDPLIKKLVSVSTGIPPSVTESSASISIPSSVIIEVSDEEKEDNESVISNASRYRQIGSNISRSSISVINNNNNNNNSINNNNNNDNLKPVSIIATLSRNRRLSTISNVNMNHNNNLNNSLPNFAGKRRDSVASSIISVSTNNSNRYISHLHPILATTIVKENRRSSNDSVISTGTGIGGTQLSRSNSIAIKNNNNKNNNINSNSKSAIAAVASRTMSSFSSSSLPMRKKPEILNDLKLMEEFDKEFANYFNEPDIIQALTIKRRPRQYLLASQKWMVVKEVKEIPFDFIHPNQENQDKSSSSSSPSNSDNIGGRSTDSVDNEIKHTMETVAIHRYYQQHHQLPLSHSHSHSHSYNHNISNSNHDPLAPKKINLLFENPLSITRFHPLPPPQTSIASQISQISQSIQTQIQTQIQTTAPSSQFVNATLSSIFTGNNQHI